MIVLDAYPRPATCLAVRLKPINDPEVLAVEPQRDYTAAGIIPSTYTADTLKVSFQAETDSPLDNAKLRAMLLNPVGECASVLADHTISEPVFPTRMPAPELPSEWGLAVSYYPILYGVITLNELEPIRGCQRSLWDITITETRKLKPQVLAWDGVSAFFNSGFCTALTVGSDGVFSHAIGELAPANPARTWSRTVGKFNNQIIADTGVTWV